MLNLLITPDFPPEFFANWHMFNTQLQRALDTTIHLQTPAGYREQQELLDSETVALVYANPFDAGSLMRDKGYIPLAKPDLPSDQVLVVANAQSAFATLDDLPADSRVLITANRDMESIGLDVLQGTAITADTVQWLHARTFTELARRLMANEAEAGLFLASSFRSLNASTQGSLKQASPIGLRYLQPKRNRPVVHQRHLHVRRKFARLRGDARGGLGAKIVIQFARHIGLGRAGKIGAQAFLRVRGKRELRHNQKLPARLLHV